MQKNHFARSSGVAIALALFLSLCASAVLAQTKQSNPANCHECHEKQPKVLPDDHKPTEGMTLESCRECHQKGGKSPSLVGKIPLAHTHTLSGMTCNKCHGPGMKKPVETEVCESCHDPLKLSQKTEKVKPENPHTSPHYGTTLNCTYCHQQHKPSENFCIQCHTFNFTVP